MSITEEIPMYLVQQKRIYNGLAAPESEHMQFGKTVTPGQRLNAESLITYKPVIKKGYSGENLTPTRITRLRDVKQPSQRNGSNFRQRSNPTDKKRNEREPAYLAPQNKSHEKAQTVKFPNVIQPENKQRPKTENVTHQDYNQEKVRTSTPEKANSSENRQEHQPANRSQQNNNNEKVQPAKNQNINQPENRNNTTTPAESTSERRRTN